MIYNYSECATMECDTMDHDDFDQVCHDDQLAHEFERDLMMTNWDKIPIHLWEDKFYELAMKIDDPDITEPYYQDVMEGGYL